MQPPEAFDRRHQVVLLDVREPEEWEAGRIEGAIHIPMGQLPERLGEVPEDRKVVTVCRSGRRSAEVASTLAGAGYDAENLDGGMQAWAEAGLPFSAPGGSPGRVA